MSLSVLPETPNRPQADLTPHPAWLAVSLVLAWVAFTLVVNTSQYGDHFEQFAWAQSLEWGYPKHPPFPSWMLAALNSLVGRQPAWPSVLSALCLAVTATCTWQIGKALIGAERAALALLLWGLQQGFASKAQLFNHNSALVALVAATAWATLAAARRSGRGDTARWHWVGVGVLAGLASLSKYQAVVPLVGLLVALAWSGALRVPQVWKGALLAAGVAIGVFLPHLSWVAQHQWSTVTYASQSGTALDFGQRLSSLGVFLVLQLRMVGPALVLLLIGLAWRHRTPHLAVEADGRTEQRAWLIGLVGVPALALVVTVMLGGLKLQDHWGIQSFQFLCLAVASLYGRSVAARWRTWITVALVLHGAWALSYALPRWMGSGHSDRQRVDQFFPAQTLAHGVTQAWQAHTTCPLRLVRGPGFESGMVAVYAGPTPRLVELDLSKSPWLDAATLARQGSMLVQLDTPPPWPPEVPEALRDDTQRGTIEFRGPGRTNAAPALLHWAYVPPTATCNPSPTRP